MSEPTKTHHTKALDMVEILFSTRQRYSIPINRINDLIHLLESIKYVKKLTPNTNTDWVSIEELIAEDVANYTKPGLALSGARHKAGLTQIELANKLGIRQENLSKMENGKRTISISMAKQLSKILKVDYRIFL